MSEGSRPLALGEAFPEVLQAARTGASWAFERLYVDLAPVVVGYLRLQGATEPDDLASEAFLGVFRGVASFTGSEEQFRSWVFTIAHRRLLDERRRVSRSPHLAPLDDYEALTGGDVEREAMEVLGQEWVLRICATLSADQRAVLLLRIVGDLSLEQVSEVTGKSVGAVKALQRRALSTLRRRIARGAVSL